MQEAPIAGAAPSMWLERAFREAPHAFVKNEAEVLPKSAAYIAVISVSMPLVRAEDLTALTREMEKRGISALEIGGGRILSREAFLAGKSPKCRMNAPAFISVEEKENEAEIERELYKRNAEFCVQNGAVIPDVENVRIDFASTVKAGAKIHPFAIVTASEIGENAEIGPFSIIERSRIEKGAVVLHSVVKDSVVGKGASIGPFAYVRMGSAVGESCRVGDFVEVKASCLADGVKAAHLAYVGDAEVGLGTNIGCGTVFANYDGREKHKTKVGNHVFIGANTNLVAPVTVGDEAYIAAATTVTRDVPEGSFVIGRTRAEYKKRE